MSSNEADSIELQKYYQERYDALESKTFTSRVFVKLDALEWMEEEDGKRFRTWTPYTGGPFDEEKCKIIKGGWDHEHCEICHNTINPGDEYLVNEVNEILCFACEKRYSRKVE